MLLPLLRTERNLVLKHHEVVAAYLSLAHDYRIVLQHHCLRHVRQAIRPEERGSCGLCWEPQVVLLAGLLGAASLITIIIG
jgi:hypothetical protein